jgi:argininosuccinate lyase
VNDLVLKGVPFREAYKIIGEKIEKGDFVPQKKVHHTHEGSIGNLCLDKISDKKQNVINKFNFSKIENAIKQLLD